MIWWLVDGGAIMTAEQALEENTSGLICYNRKRIAQLEVEQEKEQGPAMAM